eukprot:ANDGO_06524.mRNA.1 Transcription factor BTF3 homolog
MPIDQEKLQKLKAQASERAGGMRRPVKKVVHTASADAKKIEGSLKKLGLQQFPGIEEVNLFKSDQSIIHFQNPRVQANFSANTYVVSGRAEQKTVQELMPNIITQLGVGNLSALQDYIKLIQQQQASSSSEGKDSDIPEVNEDFSKHA